MKHKYTGAWIAKDKCNNILLFLTNKEQKPKKENDTWKVQLINNCCQIDPIYISSKRLPDNIKPEWLDEEPIRVRISITLSEF